MKAYIWNKVEENYENFSNNDKGNKKNPKNFYLEFCTTFESVPQACCEEFKRGRLISLPSLVGIVGVKNRLLSANLVTPVVSR